MRLFTLTGFTAIALFIASLSMTGCFWGHDHDHDRDHHDEHWDHDHDHDHDSDHHY